MRLSKIITRTGDNGSTGLADGTHHETAPPNVLPRHQSSAGSAGNVMAKERLILCILQGARITAR